MIDKKMKKGNVLALWKKLKKKRRKIKKIRRILALSQIVILIIEIVAIGYVIGIEVKIVSGEEKEAEEKELEEEEPIFNETEKPEEPQEEIKNLISAGISLLIEFLSIKQIGSVSADNRFFKGVGVYDAQAKSGQQTEDGGYILIGRYIGQYGADLFLMKTDINGNVTWAKFYRGANWEEGNSVEQTEDGGYIMTGYTESYGAGTKDVLLVKTDASGNLEWAKTIGDTGWDVGYDVKQTLDGGYIVIGYTENFGVLSFDYFIIKFDAVGNVEWAKTVGGFSQDVGKSIQQTNDEGYIVAGESSSFSGSGLLLAKFDVFGNFEWAKSTIGLAQSVQQTDDFGYITTGIGYGIGPGEWDSIVIKFDTNGAVEWVSAIGTSESDYSHSIVQSDDGGYAVIGEIVNNSGGSQSFSLRLIKLDAFGNFEWAKSIERMLGMDVQQTIDKNYMIVGYFTLMDFTREYSTLLTILDSNGNFQGCDKIENVILNVIHPITTENLVSPDITTPVVSAVDCLLNIQEVQGSSTVICEASICSPADTNPPDGIIDINELIAYIGEWKTGTVTINELIEAIGLWKSGC